MKKYFYIIIPLLVLFFLYFTFFYSENKISFFENNIHDSNLVHIKAFIKEDCSECTRVEDYLEVYKKAWVKFESISYKKYWSEEYKAHSNNYKINKLPFIVFSENLSNYKTISDSWEKTFWYKSSKWEYIVNDIIPPFYDLTDKKIKWLINLVYIWDKSCKNCYKIDDIKIILNSFWLKFKNVKEIDSKSLEWKELIEKYNIVKIPTIILSKNMELYKNFSYFWSNIWTKEKDGFFILREPEKINLIISNTNE